MINKIKKLSIIFGFMLLLVGCSDGPSDVAEKFASHMAVGEVSKAIELSTESTAGLLAMASGFGGLPIDPDFDFQLVSEDVEGNKAVVRYNGGSSDENKTINLVKIDGKWKVHEQKR